MNSNYENVEELMLVVVELIELFKVFATLSDESWSVPFVDCFAQFFHSNGNNSFLQMISRIATIEEATTGTATVYVAVCHLFKSFFNHIDSHQNTSRLFDLFQKADSSGKGIVTSYEFYKNVHANSTITRYIHCSYVTSSSPSLLPLGPILKICSIKWKQRTILLKFITAIS